MKITKQLLREMIEEEIKLLEQEEQEADATPMKDLDRLKDQDIIDLLHALTDIAFFFDSRGGFGPEKGFFAEMRKAILSTGMDDLPNTGPSGEAHSSFGPLSHKLDVFRHKNVRTFFKNKIRELAEAMYKVKQARDKLEL